MRWISITAVATISLWAAVPAQARPGTPVFDAPVVKGAELDAMRGTALPEARLTKGTVVRIADDEVRGIFRQSQSVAGTIFDWWFSTTGLELITASVRAAE